MKEGNILNSEINYLYYTGEVDTIKVEYQYNQAIKKTSKELWKNKSDSIFKIVEYNYNRSEKKMTGKSVVDGERKYLENKGFERNKRAVIWKDAKMYDLKNTD